MKFSFFSSAVLGAVFLLAGCQMFKKSSEAEQGMRIAFYNVENLFDTEDDPAINDDEFTPQGKLQWTEVRYKTKLEQLAKVVEGMRYPALLGLAEVENAAVLEDFCRKTSLSKHGYQFIHYDSPDERGIDVALLFQKSMFTPLASETIPIHFPKNVAGDDPNPATRDVLVVKGLLGKSDTLNIFVLHAPSRSGGEEKTQPERIFTAQQVKQKTEWMFQQNPNANIILMGDFNDEPDNKSVAEILAAKPLPQGAPAPQALYNCMAELDAIGEGTYNYRGVWNMLDQIILSSNLLAAKNKLHFSEASIYRQEWLMFTHDKYGQQPNRTYGGDRYYGGFSDHLPVMVVLER
jgi:endonuclease/exonuclease/phosphatase family metal-dependent hydrolase